MEIDDLYYSKQEEIYSDDMEDTEYMKKGDLAAALVHSEMESVFVLLRSKNYSLVLREQPMYQRLSVIWKISAKQ